MRLRSLAVLGVVTVLLLTGCAPEVEVSPSPSASAPSPSPTLTPTEEPIVAPTAAFDVTCDDVNAVVAGLLGAPVGAEKDTLGLTSSPGWYPGPAQYMMQRAGGIACSAGDGETFDPDSSPDAYWEIAIVPDAQTIIDGAMKRQAGGNADLTLWCDEGLCVMTLREGDVLLTGTMTSPALVKGDEDRVRAAFEGILASAAGTLREFEYGPSEIAAVQCEALLTAEEVATLLGTHVEIVDFTKLGGWGIPAEVYFVNDGGRLCMYAEGLDVYNDATLITLTTLPSGAWAFEKLDGGTPVTVTGADAALKGVDFTGRSVLDVRVGLDWLRFSTADSAIAPSLVPVAEMAVEHLTRGRPAPQ
ncbi:hypothetical protein [Microbacterium saperdae]|nr:hypothetical protein [Microbacterium saperdae]